jgi:hypothetical protein
MTWVAALALGGACASTSRPPESAARASRTAADVRRDSTFEALRRQVTSGSIIADAQMGRIPPMAVGACVNPVAAARFELDRSFRYEPDQPPKAQGQLVVPELPESLRASDVGTGVVLARWVVDTDGTAIPGSTTIVSSPHGLMSLQVCGAILMARLTPARDEGKLVRARVEVPVRFAP